MLKRGYKWMSDTGCIRTSEVDMVKNMVNRLIENLYRPDKSDLEWVTDEQKIEGMDHEPINWGDLSCTDVIKVEGEDRYIATLEECAEGQCPQLCRYIEEYMTAWGWSVICVTEW